MAIHPWSGSLTHSPLSRELRYSVETEPDDSVIVVKRFGHRVPSLLLEFRLRGVEPVDARKRHENSDQTTWSPTQTTRMVRCRSDDRDTAQCHKPFRSPDQPATSKPSLWWRW